MSQFELILKIVFVILIAWKEEEAYVECRHGYPHFRHQYRHNSRSRFMARLKGLGSAKVEQLREGKLTLNRALPPGFAVIDGEVMDVSYKLIQRKWQAGTAYFAYNDRTQQFPLYIRPTDEVDYHFIVFQDPFYWRGSGHLILLKKVLGVNAGIGRFNLLYDAYVLSLRATIHPQVDVYNSEFFYELKRKREFINNFKQRRYQKVSKHQQIYLRDKQGNLGRRKRRSARKEIKTKPKILHIDMNWKSDCVLRPLNVSRLLKQVKRAMFEKLKLQKQLTLTGIFNLSVNKSSSTLNM